MTGLLIAIGIGFLVAATFVCVVLTIASARAREHADDCACAAADWGAIQTDPMMTAHLDAERPGAVVYDYTRRTA